MTSRPPFRSKHFQALKLPEDVAFPESAGTGGVQREGQRRVIVPVDAVWDDFFDAPGIDLGDRDQPA